MSVTPCFENPPITEALLDIKISPVSESELPKLEEIHSLLNGTYPDKQTRHTMTGNIQLASGHTPQIVSSLQQLDGYFFKTNDGKKIVQARLDGYTFNMLKPYSHWSDFREEAKKNWYFFKQVIDATSIVRIALRYINRIELPLPLVDLKEYFTTVVEIGPGMPNKLTNFFTRLTIPSDTNNAVAVVTQTMEKPDPSKTTLTIIFDIDVSMKEIFALNDESIWDKFEELRSFKNTIFLNSLTIKTRELFQ